jgi:hypothetical protein
MADARLDLLAVGFVLASLGLLLFAPLARVGVALDISGMKRERPLWRRCRAVVGPRSPSSPARGHWCSWTDPNSP